MVTDAETPCRFVADHVVHPAHDWTSLVQDPDDDHVLHLFTGASLPCPGWTPTREDPT